MIAQRLHFLNAAKIMLILFLFFALPLTSFSAVATPILKIYNGTLLKKNTSYRLLTSNSAGQLTGDFSLAFQSSVTETIIKRLNTDDFISIQATRDLPSNKNKLNISGINFVGLHSLIGNWVGDDEVCYVFQNFTTLILHNKNKSGVCIAPLNNSDPKLARKMSYFVNPDEDGWLLQISDKSTQYIAELTIKNAKTIQLNLFDEQTGVILSKITLRR